MRTRLTLIAAALLLWAASSTAQVVVNPAPGVNGAGLAKTDITIPNGNVLRVIMATPTAPTITQSAAGTLANGTYKMSVTSIDPAGGQTMYPTAVNCVVTAGTDDACIATWTAVAGTVTYRVWMSDAGGTTLVRYWPVTAPTVTLTITSLAMATVVDPGTPPTVASAYRSSLGGAAGWFGSPITITDAVSAASGSLAGSALNIAQTWNTSGTPTGLKFTITDTASNAASLAMQILGGAAGATNLFSVGKSGILTIPGQANVTGIYSTAGITVAAGVAFATSGRGQLLATGDGTWYIANSALTGFTTLNLGPTTGNTANGTLQFDKVSTVINMATATGTGTGTITSPTTALPAGTLIKAVTCRVNPALAGLLLTTFSLGDGSDVDKWGSGLAIDLNTLVNVANYNITSPTYQVAAGSLVLTAAAGVFSTGILSCTTFLERYINIATP
jgi:hypothetical protein